MPAIQLQLGFSAHPPSRADPVLPDSAWQDVTDLAHGAGVHSDCLVSTNLLERLDDQALYDAIWTANYTLSLNYSERIRFSLALPDKLLILKATQTNRALHLGCVTDF
jgi:hypothetical protein